MTTERQHKIAGIQREIPKTEIFGADRGIKEGDTAKRTGAIVDTPAVGDLDGAASGPDSLPEIVVGTNEEYQADRHGVELLQRVPAKGDRQRCAGRRDP